MAAPAPETERDRIRLIARLVHMGYYFVTKLGQLDVYAVMAYLALTACIIVLFNLVADLLYGLLDPRIRYD